MAYNKQYNTRFSGRYNTPGQFVSAGEAKPEDEMTVDNDVAMAMPKNEGPGVVRPHWMKSKLPGVKKVSNKERRRRQNENLRRLLTPKNALMVLNEMMPNEQVANQFKVEPSANNQYYKATNTHSFCADLTIDGNCYKGYGENKLMARNAAAEQAIRDLIIKKMNKAVTSDSGSTNGDAAIPNLNGDASKEDELSARLSMENGKEAVNGANGDSNKVDQGKKESVEVEVADIKVKTVAVDEPRNDPIEQPTEA